MRNQLTRVLGFCGGLLLACAPGWAHHGSAISYDTQRLWTTWATGTEFNYLNPHPSMTFDRTDNNGKVEHWVSELLTNPSALARAGWTKSRSVEALKPGTKVKLYVGTSRGGGVILLITRIEHQNIDKLATDRANLTTL